MDRVPYPDRQPMEEAADPVTEDLDSGWAEDPATAEVADPGAATRVLNYSKLSTRNIRKIRNT